MAEYNFNISLQTFDASLLPSGSPAKGSKDFATAVHHFLQEQFAGFKGDARIVVSEDSILVEWTPPPTVKDPIEAAVILLEKGEMIPAIVMLELLRQTHPNDLPGQFPVRRREVISRMEPGPTERGLMCVAQ